MSMSRVREIVNATNGHDYLFVGMMTFDVKKAFNSEPWTRIIFIILGIISAERAGLGISSENNWSLSLWQKYNHFPFRWVFTEYVGKLWRSSKFGP